MRDTHLQDGKSLKMCHPWGSKLGFCCHGNGAYWVTVLPWHVSPWWCGPDHTHQHLTSCDKKGGFITDCWGQRLHARVCVCVWSFCFFPRLLILSYILHTPLTHAPSTHLQGGVSSPGAGTNMECVGTARRQTSFSHSWFLVSDLFSLVAELDTLWQCAPRRRTRERTLHRCQFSCTGAETFIQRENLSVHTSLTDLVTTCF